VIELVEIDHEVNPSINKDYQARYFNQNLDFGDGGNLVHNFLFWRTGLCTVCVGLDCIGMLNLADLVTPLRVLLDYLNVVLNEFRVS
jgi:hypothetical protein